MRKCGYQFYNMKKFQAIIHFNINDDFMSLVPSHRTYINHLMNKGIIDSYAVSMETQTCWITMNTDNKEAAEKHLFESPLHKYWNFTIEELFVYDSQHYRLPAVQLN